MGLERANSVAALRLLRLTRRPYGSRHGLSSLATPLLPQRPHSAGRKKLGCARRQSDFTLALSRACFRLAASPNKHNQRGWKESKHYEHQNRNPLRPAVH